MSFGSATAFADEEQSDEASLQAVEKTTSIKGGSNYDTATEIRFDSDTDLTNTFTSDTTSFVDCYYKIVLEQDGYINFPELITDNQGHGAVTIYWIHSDTGHTEFWRSSDYYDQNLGLAKGTYYLYMKPYFYNAAGSASETVITMKMNFVASNVWEKESNNSFDQANSVNLNTRYYGSNAENATQYCDYYKFNVSGTKSISVKWWDESATTMEICDANHNTVKRFTPDGNVSGSVDKESIVELSEGTYYLRMWTGHYSSNKNYSFQINATDVQKADVQKVTMYRLYNKWNGEHLFTSDMKECDKLESIGWKKEGEAWKSPSTSSKPVYRLYNPYTSDHHYTTDEGEYNTCGSNGWKKEGIAWYSDENEGMPVYRLYNKYVTVGTHHYTTSKKEYNDLKNIGWIGEGEGWYGLK